MDDAEFKGYVTRALEDNDKAHKAVFEKLGKIDKTMTDLKISSAKGGMIGGAITTAAAFIFLWVKSQLK